MRKTWLLIFLFTGSVAIWFSQSAIREFVSYYRLNATVPIIQCAWEVNEITPGRFALNAQYLFESDGDIYNGSTTFQKPVYLNRLTAERDLAKWETLEWSVWIDAKEPKHSSLQKLFPLKNLFYAASTLGVFGYFLFLFLKRRLASQDSPERPGTVQ